MAGPAGLGFASAKPSVPPRSKNRELALGFYSLRRPVEPTVLILPILDTELNKDPVGLSLIPWLDRQDSNLRMLGPKPSALPLGDGPMTYILP